MITDEHEYFEQFGGENIFDVPITVLRGKITNRSYNAVFRYFYSIEKNSPTIDDLIAWLESGEALYARSVGVGTANEIRVALANLYYI